MFPGLVTRPLRAALVVLVAAAVVVGWLAWRDARSSSAVSEDAALRAFRQAPAATGPERPGVPASGVYTYRQVGSERGGLGPASVSRSLPDRARLVVVRTREGYREELHMSQDHIEAVTLRVGRDGVRETARRTDVSFLGIGRDDRRDLTPPPLRLRRPLTVGARWSGRYLLGPLPASLAGRVLRADTIAVGGETLPVVVVRLTSRTGGTHPAVRTETLWWSRARGLALRRVVSLEVGGVVTLRTRADLALQSTTPQV